MKVVTRIDSQTVVLPLDDIDTDQIIPARFLTTTVKEGLGDHLFTDWRYDANGNTVDEFVLNQTQAEGAAILVAGRNFGGGSSRDHAPWALLDYGFQVVISTEIADIFFHNSLKNGLIPVIVNNATHCWLLENPGADITVDSDTLKLIIPGHEPISFNIDRFSRYCLLNGIDQLGYLRQHADSIDKFEEKRK